MNRSRALARLAVAICLTALTAPTTQSAESGGGRGAPGFSIAPGQFGGVIAAGKPGSWSVLAGGTSIDVRGTTVSITPAGLSPTAVFTAKRGADGALTTSDGSRFGPKPGDVRLPDGSFIDPASNTVYNAKTDTTFTYDPVTRTARVCTGGRCTNVSEDGTESGPTGDAGVPNVGPGSGIQGLAGDPYFLSVDGGFLAYQGAGEYDVVLSNDGSFRLQARLEPMPGRNDASVATAFATTIGETRVAVYAGSPLVVRLDGIRVTKPTGPVSVLTSTRVGFVWPDGSALDVTPIPAGGIDYSLRLASNRRGTIAGLAGDWNSEPGDDFASRDGTRVDQNDEAAIYDLLGESWRIAPSDSLFDYERGESSETFQRRSFPTRRISPSELPVGRQIASFRTCSEAGVADVRLLLGCSHDVALTGRTAFATDAVEYSKRTGRRVRQLTTREKRAAVPTSTTSVPPAPGGPVELGDASSRWRWRITGPVQEVTSAWEAAGAVNQKPAPGKAFIGVPVEATFLGTNPSALWGNAGSAVAVIGVREIEPATPGLVPDDFLDCVIAFTNETTAGSSVRCTFTFEMNPTERASFALLLRTGAEERRLVPR